MVTRPEQHQTDSQGKALLRSAFARLGWTVNEIGEDYGRDFEIEVFRNTQSTGISFSVQLKSSVAPAYSADGEFVSQELDRPNALYLAREIRHPVLLIVADVAQQRLFWAAPQTDTALLKGLRELAQQRMHKAGIVPAPIIEEDLARHHRLLAAVTQLCYLLAPPFQEYAIIKKPGKSLAPCFCGFQNGCDIPAISFA
jgi:hypothetical protein